MRLAIGDARSKGYLLSSIVVGTVSIESRYHYGCCLGLRSWFGLLATAGNPKKYTHQ